MGSVDLDELLEEFVDELAVFGWERRSGRSRAAPGRKAQDGNVELKTSSSQVAPRLHVCLFLRLLRAHPAQDDSIRGNQRKLMRRTPGNAGPSANIFLIGERKA
jgi:hypothetical protein